MRYQRRTRQYNSSQSYLCQTYSSLSLLSNWDNSAKYKIPKYKIPLNWKKIVYQKKDCCFFYFNDSGLSCQEGQKEGYLPNKGSATILNEN